MEVVPFQTSNILYMWCMNAPWTHFQIELSNNGISENIAKCATDSTSFSKRCQWEQMRQSVLGCSGCTLWPFCILYLSRLIYSIKAQIALTCQSVIHIKTKTLDLLHGQTSVDKHSGRGKQCVVKQCRTAVNIACCHIQHTSKSKQTGLICCCTFFIFQI